MCSNYRPVSSGDRLLTFFGVERAPDELPPDVWPGYLAPFIRLAETGSGNRRIAEIGHFGLLPQFATELAYGRRTYNARSETVAKLPSFRDSWRRGKRCIIPAECIFEPNWETGRAVRWRIQQPGAVPMGIAGVYAPPIDGVGTWSFAMLTVNADGHATFQRFHRPADEKRMVVILRPEDYDAWLSCPVEEAAKFFTRWEGPLDCMADPLPPRVARPKAEPPEPPPEDPGLF